jgi:hypothetical protein
MARFHLLHIVPDPKLHGLYGYREVIETVFWGLEQLGHNVSYAINKPENAATNIIFGAQMLPLTFQQQLPSDSIVYNFEQMRGYETSEVRDEVRSLAENFRIWDYSPVNIESWAKLKARLPVKVVPVGYAPILTRIPKTDPQDIDVLIYGLSGQKRLEVFHTLSQNWIRTVFVSGMYASARDNLISRAKIVLNINLYEHSKIFEIVRTSYLLANKKAVIADRDKETFVEPDLENAVHFAASADIVRDCLKLLEDTKELQQLEERGYTAFLKRDIRKILVSALD